MPLLYKLKKKQWRVAERPLRLPFAKFGVREGQAYFFWKLVFAGYQERQTYNWYGKRSLGPFAIYHYITVTMLTKKQHNSNKNFKNTLDFPYVLPLTNLIQLTIKTIKWPICPQTSPKKIALSHLCQ